MALLAAVLIFATVRPRRLPEAVAAVPAAGLLVATGVVTWPAARHELAALGPTVGFLAAVLMLAHAADRAGVFAYAGAVAARWSAGRPQRLLAVVFGIAAVTTAVLSLDATVVLLTPVVLLTTQTLRVRAKPHVFACAHLANSASLLLPVANLTNLLAFTASGLTFLRFAELMTLPWLAVIAVEYLVFRRFFAHDLAAPPTPVSPADPAVPPLPDGPDDSAVPAVPTGPDNAVVPPGPGESTEPPGSIVPATVVRAPRFALAVLGLTLVGFAALEPLGIAPGWVALAGAVIIGTRDVLATERGQRARVAGRLVAASNPGFCAFVFALGVVVLAVGDTGLGRSVARLVPASSGFLGLLGAAALAAVLANVLNNLPATLLLVPLVAHSPALVLAVLIGVNIGPNLTYVGSLATLLWREVLHARDHSPDTREFLRLGAITVPACLVAATAALWLAARAMGIA